MKYKANSTEEAILNAKCQLLKATTMGMVATNAERIRNNQSVAYTEEHFYSVSEDLRSYMESLEAKQEFVVDSMTEQLHKPGCGVFERTLVNPYGGDCSCGYGPYDPKDGG